MRKNKLKLKFKITIDSLTTHIPVLTPTPPIPAVSFSELFGEETGFTMIGMLIDTPDLIETFIKDKPYIEFEGYGDSIGRLYRSGILEMEYVEGSAFDRDRIISFYLSLKKKGISAELIGLTDKERINIFGESL